MPLLKENIPLGSLNTFGVAATARYYSYITSPTDLMPLLSEPVLSDLPKLILGGGSNILFTKNFPGWVIHMGIQGINKIAENSQHCWLQVGAGVNWHHLVLHCIEQGYAGIENLSLIPGSVGAAPVQNIGAYGAELSEVFDSLVAVEITTGKNRRFDKADCAFGYRNSVFKEELNGQYIILQVTLRLNKQPIFKTTYGAINDVLASMNHQEISIKAISDAVIHIRNQKLPHPAHIGSAGSFFKNPIIPNSLARSIQKDYPDLPTYPIDDAHVKVPAAWLIEQCGWKGYQADQVGVYPHQAVVLCNYGNASGKQVHALAKNIQASVEKKFHTLLVPEVKIFPKLAYNIIGIIKRQIASGRVHAFMLLLVIEALDKQLYFLTYPFNRNGPSYLHHSLLEMVIKLATYARYQMQESTMQLTKTPLLGLPLIEPQVIADHRGYFMECYHQSKFNQQGLPPIFVQENQSFSKQGTIRGLHYQLPPYAQAKLVRVVHGAIWDIAVDLRKGSPTFGQWEGVLLSEQNKKQFLIPKGYAHGFSVLSPEATVIYQCDQLHHSPAEAGILWADPSLAIDWQRSAITTFKKRNPPLYLPFFMIKVLITGAQGQLAQALAEQKRFHQDIAAIYASKTTCDITNLPQLTAYLNSHPIDYLINCAAYTQVDQAEVDRTSAHLVNATAPDYLAQLAKKSGFTLLHLSTDYVFDGLKATPLTEDMPTQPINYYGVTKLLGEQSIMAHRIPAYIIRTSSVFSTFGSNFFTRLLAKATTDSQVKMVCDQVSSPTYAPDLANTLWKIILCLQANPHHYPTGVYHYANEGIASRYDFAQYIDKKKQLNCYFTASYTHELSGLAKRPTYIPLASTYRIGKQV
eukprot:gene3050-3814_t